MKTKNIQISFVKSISLSDAYYDTQKELHEYQRNLKIIFGIFSI